MKGTKERRIILPISNVELEVGTDMLQSAPSSMKSHE
jgi:hypothetical protein